MGTENDFGDELDLEMANLLLSEELNKPKGGRGPKQDPTEPRISVVWFRLPTKLSVKCDNPNCTDPRPVNDKGRNVTVEVKGQRVCRYCFLGGWLSDVST